MNIICMYLNIIIVIILYKYNYNIIFPIYEFYQFYQLFKYKFSNKSYFLFVEKIGPKWSPFFSERRLYLTAKSLNRIR